MPPKCKKPLIFGACSSASILFGLSDQLRAKPEIYPANARDRIHEAQLTWPRVRPHASWSRAVPYRPGRWDAERHGGAGRACRSLQLDNMWPLALHKRNGHEAAVRARRLEEEEALARSARGGAVYRNSNHHSHRWAFTDRRGLGQGEPQAKPSVLRCAR